MNRVDQMMFSLDYALWGMARVFGKSIESYCDVVAIERDANGHARLVARDGSIGSMIRIKGVRSLVRSESFNCMMESIIQSWSSQISKPGHVIQVTHEYDPDPVRVDKFLDDYFKPQMQTIEHLELDLADIILAWKQRLKEYISVENTYLIVWSATDLLSKMEISSSHKKLTKELEGHPFLGSAQPLISSLPALREVHRSFVESTLHIFNRAGVVVEEMDISDEGARSIRESCDPAWTSYDWKPRIIGDNPPVMQESRGQPMKDYENVGYPMMASQFIPRGFEVKDYTTIAMGNRLITPIVMSLPPSKLLPFAYLSNSLTGSDIPWRISITLDSSGIKSAAFKLKKILSIISNTKLLKGAMKQVASNVDYKVDQCGFQVSMTTWVHGDYDDISVRDQLRLQTEKIATALQSWGSCEADDRVGSPAPVVMSNIPGLKLTNESPLAIAETGDAIALLPLTRPTSPWQYGALPFRTHDKRLFPVSRFSQMQAKWGALVYAPMGGGKTVLLNTLNLASVIQGGLDTLPAISIIDIGDSASQIIDLLSDALPEHKRHQVIRRHLRMDVRDAINPGDTLLGCRYPLPEQKAFLTEYLVMLASPSDAKGRALNPPDGIQGVASMVVDLAYKHADKNEAKPFNYGVSPEIDKAIDRFDIKIDSVTTWWEVVDAFHAIGEYVWAESAQRYAVPILADFGALACHEAVSSVYKNKQSPTGESINEYFQKAISEAIRMYPILSAPTQVNLAAGRIVALDLAAIAPKGSGRQSSAMYLLCMNKLMQSFYAHEDDLAFIPGAYHDFHSQRISDLNSLDKTLMIDEFHRTDGSEAVMKIIDGVIREGRKRHIDTILASQRLKDFNEDMIELIPTFYVLGSGKISRDETMQILKLPPGSEGVLDRLGNPDKHGARMLALFETKDGNYCHEVINTLPTVLLWEFTSTTEDMQIRNLVSSKVGRVKARKLLTQRFPSGSAKGEVERMKNTVIKTSELTDKQRTRKIVIELAKDVLRKGV